jgi:hypothetical protein
MNFKELENSQFYKLGKKMFLLDTIEFRDTFGSMFDTMLVYPADHVNYVPQTYPIAPHRSVVCLHIQTVLDLKFDMPDGKSWIPEEFRTEITRQWNEVSNIVDRVLTENNSDPSKKKVSLLHGRVVIIPPGIPPSPHGHRCPQTLTVAYRFQEDKIDLGEPTSLELGWDRSNKIALPDEDKYYFVMKNDPIHSIISNEWSFFWFNDFSDHIDIPDLGFFEFQNPALDSTNSL